MQFSVSNFRDMVAAAQSVMAALPYDPWLLNLRVRFPSSVFALDEPLSQDLKKHPVIDIRVLLRGSMTQPGDGIFKVFKIKLALKFTVNDSDAQFIVDLAWKQSADASWPPHIENVVGTSMMASANDLHEAVRTILTPIITDTATISMDQLVARSAKAILRGKLPPLGLCEVLDSVIVRIGTVNGKEPRMTWRSFVSLGHIKPKDRDKIYVALGSNIGDRFGAIESACRSLDNYADIRVVETSPLYETEPMYVEDQGRFLNGICEVRFTSPIVICEMVS